ncbi:hypothetical protein VIN7_8307 [Saccharomyces cerevisiae x Saccharomyces kudriavzevii VIN7]|uniref:Uncharacterized protein n=1 Tax=Saccharomyces cerevisiae x Saccharomyces kudriavzevii (strain VIN7) TaxID=1095631 RepID=H0GXF1_SACCK|nr:hypothetical protein VIN7_8307 [Saccharomyces cerevisiae x Saccharomyces kudriavzevii VIN7]
MANELQPVLNAFVTLLDIPPAPDICAPNLYFETADLTKLDVEGIVMVAAWKEVVYFLRLAFLIQSLHFLMSAINFSMQGKKKEKRTRQEEKNFVLNLFKRKNHEKRRTYGEKNVCLYK